jgi:hypothetical protein
LKWRWGGKGEGFASTALCQRTACDADVLGTQLKVAKSFFRRPHSVGRTSVLVPDWEHVDARGALSLYCSGFTTDERKSGCRGTPNSRHMSGTRGKGMYCSVRGLSQQIRDKLSPVLNHCSERADVWTGPWSLKKQTLENVAFEIYHSGIRARINERVGLCRGPQSSMSNTRLRRRSSAAVEIWKIVVDGARTGENWKWQSLRIWQPQLQLAGPLTKSEATEEDRKGLFGGGGEAGCTVCLPYSV